jgi:hypothetical protein
LESCLQDVNDVLAQLDLATQRLEATDDYLAMQARISQNKLLTIGTQQDISHHVQQTRALYCGGRLSGCGCVVCRCDCGGAAALT